MWNIYSKDYLKHNRASGISVLAGVFIAALFLSFLCGFFYNLWLDEIAQIVNEEGDWQARITGDPDTIDLDAIRRFANVKHAVPADDPSKEGTVTVNLYFDNLRTIHQDMQRITETLGLEENTADYNYQLLSMYFVRIPGDPMPRLIMPLYLFIVVLVSLSMILVIHHSFALSMNSRIRQFGIFSSIGATPKQIRICLMQEAAVLSLAPILAGVLGGILLTWGVLKIMSLITVQIAGARSIRFHYHPAILAVTLFFSVITALFSARIPAGRLSRLTPLEAIRGTQEPGLKKKKHSPVLSFFFGIEGELAGNALKAQKKALRTATLSLTLSFLGFTLIQCFFTLSGISTNHTYFERYQDVWDVMVTIKDTKIEDFQPVKELQALTGQESCIVYQKAETAGLIPGDCLSEELAALDFQAMAGTCVTSRDGSYLIRLPLVILDDASFLEYCAQIGAAGTLGKAIVLNRIWDSTDSNFRYPKYIPYLKESLSSIPLQNSAPLPVLAYTDKLPVLREEYTDYALTVFIPLSLWRELPDLKEAAEKDIYARIIAQNRTSLEQLNLLEQEAVQIIGSDYETQSENRIQEKITNDEMICGYRIVLGSFCALLALIGIANVFSNTLGFLRQRKREFARYQSVGLTPGGIRKIFCIEALVTVGRPFLITLILTVIAIGYMIQASYLDPLEFMAAAPVIPILAFFLSVFAFVALAYYLGGKRVLQVTLAEALRNDTLI